MQAIKQGILGGGGGPPVPLVPAAAAIIPHILTRGREFLPVPLKSMKPTKRMAGMIFMINFDDLLIIFFSFISSYMYMHLHKVIKFWFYDDKGSKKKHQLINQLFFSSYNLLHVITLHVWYCISNRVSLLYFLKTT